MPIREIAASDGERRLVRSWRWLRAQSGHSGTVLLTIGVILLAFGVGHLVLFIAGIVSSSVGLVLSVSLAPRYAKLIEEQRDSSARAVARSQSLQAIMRSSLRALMDDLSVDFSAARITVYRHKQDSFIMLARVSQSQELERKGRQQYPDDEGVIGKAWNLGSASVTNLPDDQQAWIDHCVSEYGMSRSSTVQLAMRSRSLVGLRIDTPDADPKHVGLIILESTTARGVSGATLDELDSAQTFSLLSQILLEVVQCLDEQDVRDFGDVVVK